MRTHSCVSLCTRLYVCLCANMVCVCLCVYIYSESFVSVFAAYFEASFSCHVLVRLLLGFFHILLFSAFALLIVLWHFVSSLRKYLSHCRFVL